MSPPFSPLLSSVDCGHACGTLAATSRIGHRPACLVCPEVPGPDRDIKSSICPLPGARDTSKSGIDYRDAMLRNWALFKAKWNMPAERRLEEGYALPATALEGVPLRISLPESEIVPWR